MHYDLSFLLTFDSFLSFYCVPPFLSFFLLSSLLLSIYFLYNTRLVKCAYEALAAAIATVKMGTLYRDIGAAISGVTEEAKCSIVTTYCGHGIGSLFHTTPNVPHYPRNKAREACRWDTCSR